MKFRNYLKIKNLKLKIISIAKWCWATLPRKIVSCLVITGILLSSFWFLLLRPKPAEAAWWDEDWLYRRPIPILTHDSAETDVYILFDGNGGRPFIDTSGDKFQADCGDLRFTKYNGELLDYYIVSGCGGASTVVHVLFDTFPADAQTIYYYYGNPSVDNGFKSSDFSTVATENYTFDTIGDEEKGLGPVLWLRFDEGYGTTAFDSSEQGNDGTITDATWTNSGKFDKALDFDTPGDVVTVTQSASVNLSGKSAYSISAWIYPHSDGGGDVGGEIIDKGTNNYFRVDSEGADGYLDVEGKLDLDDTDANLNIADAIRVNRWSHIVMTYEDDGDDEITIYINGVNMGTSVSSGIGSPSDDSGDNLLIGGDANATFDGFIDEVIIYPYARSAAQVKRNYNQGAAARIGRDDSWITEGLIGYWKMDEASWDGTADEVIDSSGAGNHGVRADGATTGSGKFGKAGVFDGDGDYINLGDVVEVTGTAELTVSVWVKTPLTEGDDDIIIGKFGGGDDTFLLRYRTDDKIWWTVSNSIGTDAIAKKSGILSANVWHHVVGVYNGTNVLVYVNSVVGSEIGNLTGLTVYESSHDLRIGNTGASTWNGAIDDVRIYNRALSEFEVRRFYDWGPPPVGEWNFDEGSGSNAYDSSENENTGAITDATWKTAADCKYGSCLDLDGDGDDITISSMNYPNSDITTISVWVNPRNIGEVEGRILEFASGLAFLLDSGRDPAIRLNRLHSGTTGSWRDMNDAIPYNEWSHLAVVYDASSVDNDASLYINGVLDTNFVRIVSPTGTADDLNGTTLTIGSNAANLRDFDGAIDDVKIYNYVRTQKQIIEDMLGGRPAVTERTSSAGSMVGYWKFDEGYGTTAYDASGRGNHLILSNDTESFAIAGKFGMAWDGDGTEYLSLSDNSDFDFNPTDDFSISGWFKHDTISGIEYIVAKHEAGTAGGYKIYMDGDGDIAFAIDDDGTWGPEDIIGDDQGKDYDDNAWHYFAGVKQGISSIRLYVDGIEIDNDTSLTATDTLSNAASFYVGIGADGAAGPFDGELDEIKVYRFALSPEEILLDYNKGKSVIMGAVSTKLDGTTPSWSQDRAYCPPGFTGTCNPPVGEWKFEERSGATAYDTGANSNDGALNGPPTWKTAADCKYGSCLDFDGDGDYINVLKDDFNYSNVSLGVWVYSTSDVEGHSVHIGNSGTVEWFSISHVGGNFHTAIDDNENRGGCGKIIYSTVGESYNNAWHYVVATVSVGDRLRLYIDGVEYGSGASLAGCVLEYAYTYGYTIGSERELTNEFNGTIDEVKIFDYALTQEQVSWLYNKGKPVGHWKFDEGEGSTAKDSSVNNNTGTLTNMTSADWVTGKFNSGLDFDSTDDVVTVTQDADINLTSKTSYAISVWVYPRSSGESDPNGGQFISKGANTYMRVDTSSGGRVNVAGSLDLATTPATLSISSAISLNTWSHILMAYTDDDDDEITIYVNGVNMGSSTNGDGSLATDSNNLLIGGSTSANFDGVIDKVKIYNYALTAQQVKLDYNQGAALRFGD